VNSRIYYAVEQTVKNEDKSSSRNKLTVCSIDAQLAGRAGEIVLLNAYFSERPNPEATGIGDYVERPCLHTPCETILPLAGLAPGPRIG
jgi:hypothetical protein